MNLKNWRKEALDCFENIMKIMDGNQEVPKKRPRLAKEYLGREKQIVEENLKAKVKFNKLLK